ncbi:hypothetical protein RISK_002179 [Rhodopirellula islandica]|uniref:Uncharacterized protein n=1 Tax=Rhodopirellula islandica TaxID=595434 RepID=A0A0J1BG64_RHOIS|nr:hypothetical protein RISK_002179 [Rhodopirellula islandica]
MFQRIFVCGLKRQRHDEHETLKRVPSAAGPIPIATQPT